MSPRKLCILGYGKVSRELHRPAWEALAAVGKVRITTICEPSAAGARGARQDFPDASVIQEPATVVLASVNCDLVDICTPGHTHAALTLQALARGLDVLVEKPLCHTVEEADAIIAATGRAAVSVCQTLRFTAPSLALIQARDLGRLGEVTRIQVTHHARHALSEAEWVTRSRPDGVLFENAIHFLDLAHATLGDGIELGIDAVKFYETSHRRVLTGFELLASDVNGRHVSIDFLQDSLVHSGLHTRVLVSGTGADAELRFYPPGFRLFSGAVDPLNDMRADVRRLIQLGGTFRDPRRRARPHLVLARDLLDAAVHGRRTLVPPSAVRPTIAVLDQLGKLWASATPTPTRRPTTASTVQSAGRRSGMRGTAG